MRVRATVGALLVVVLLAACGGGGDDDEATTETTKSKTTTPVSVADPSKIAGALALAPAECRAAIAAFASGPAAAFSGSASSTDYGQVETYLKKVQSSAPSEIKDDLGFIVEFYGKFVEALKDAGVDFSKPETVTADKLQKLQGAFADLDQEKYQTASQKVSDYFEEHCKTG